MLAGRFLGLFQPAALAAEVIPFFEPGGFQAEGASVRPLFKIIEVRKVDLRVASCHFQPGLAAAFPVMIAQHQIEGNACVHGRFHGGEETAFQQGVVGTGDAVRIDKIPQVAHLVTFQVHQRLPHGHGRGIAPAAIAHSADSLPGQGLLMNQPGAVGRMPPPAQRGSDQGKQ